MGMKCYECKTDNPSDSGYNKEYVTLLSFSEGIPSTPTHTLKMPVDGLIAGTTLFGRYQIIQEQGKG